MKSGRDALQYEQGEDRWLCSLLFQQGHRCEYVPAASARTFAPETLDEFFNQVRLTIYVITFRDEAIEYDDFS